MSTATFSGVRRRVVRMTAAWLFIGGLVGGQLGLQVDGSFVGLLSYTIAGWIVFFPVGILLGPFSDRAAQAVICAAWGMLIGLLSSFCHALHVPNDAACLGGVIGGLTGATCWPCLRGVLAFASQLSRLAGKVAFESFPRVRQP